MIRDLYHELYKDIRYGARTLARSPGFTAVAVLALALGVGANTSVFSLVNALFLRPLPVEDPSTLVWLTMRSAESSRTLNLSWPDFLDYRERNKVLSDMVAYGQIPVAFAVEGQPERISGQIVTGDYFTVLGVKPAAGRVFTAQEDKAPGAAPVAVVSHRLWERRFGSDPALPGRVVTINGQPFSVVGVAPKGFTGTELGRPAEIWVPFAMHTQAAPPLETTLASRGSSWLQVIGRLKPGVSLEQARAALGVIASQIAAEHPAERKGFTVIPQRMTGGIHPSNSGEAAPIAALLMAATTSVLLISCFNVANMLLARTAGRRREIGIRLALGATRFRLIRQLLTESMLLALMGAGAGLLLAAWIPDLLGALANLPEDITGAVTPDVRVLAFTLALALLTGLLSGLAPALNAARGDVSPALKDEGFSAIGGSRRGRLQHVFVVAQVALSLVLLVSAGLFLRSLGKAARIDPGFDVSQTLSLSFDLQTQGYAEEKRAAFRRELLERVESLPGVRSATLASLVPMSGRMIGMDVTLEATSAAAGGSGAPEGAGTAMVNIVAPDYFRTLAIPLLRGRDFSSGDKQGAPGVVIVNETLAGRFFEGTEPLGRRVSVDGPGGPWLEIIGVAKDSRYDELTEDTRPFMYLPLMQHADVMPETSIIVSTAGDPARELGSVVREARRLDAALPLFDAGTLASLLRQRSDRQQGISGMLALFGFLALTLAAMGLYGVMAFSVSRRTHEIGIRMALGAKDRDVVALFVREGVRLSLLGIAVGSLLALGLTQALASMLFGVTPTDLITFMGVGALLAAVAAAASWLPARRAARLDPMLALRYD